MDNKTFADTLADLREEEDKVLGAKGADYAEGLGVEEDRLANFKTLNILLHGAPLDQTTVCAVYWLKHVIAVCKAVRERNVASEPLLGRFTDERNYSALLLANFRETNPGLLLNTTEDR